MDESGRHSSERQLVVFQLAGEAYGVEITTVREIITMQPVTPIPRTPEFVRGIINLRGRVIPVVDLRRLLSLAQGDAGRETRIMVVEVGTRTVGCIVDAVKEVLTISDEVIEPPTGAAGPEGEYLKGIAKVGDSLVILVDLQRVLAADEAGGLIRAS